MEGFYFGTCLDSNHQPLEPAVVPPAVQPLHMGIFGSTGVGKSMLLLAGAIENRQATDGADVFLLQKQGTFGRELLQTQYACAGTLAETYYFDLEDVMVPIQFFDIDPLVASGMSRSTAVERLCDHYIAIARRVVGEAYGNAVRAEAVTRSFIKALFDRQPAFRHTALRDAIRRFTDDGTVPDVSDDALARSLADHAAMPADTRELVGDAILFRMNEIMDTPQLRAVLDPPPAGADDADSGLDIRTLLDESATIILDLGGLSERRRHAVGTVLVTQLWRALKRRLQTPNSEHPLVNLYIEEAAAFKDLSVLTELLTQGREFDVSLTLLAQSPAQLITDGDESDVGTALLANAGTIATGRLPMASALADRLSTPTTDRERMADLISGLDRDEWLFERSSVWGAPRPPVSLLAPPSPPPGHPESAYPLAESCLESAFEEAFAARQQAVRAAAVDLTVERPDPPTKHGPDTEYSPAELAFKRCNLLPVTTRLPDPVTYDLGRHQLQCADCETSYRPTHEGLDHAVTCCHTWDGIDRDAVPVIECYPDVNLESLQPAGLTVTQALFLQTVHDATHQRVRPAGFSLCHDSMLRLRDYTGIDNHAIEALIEDGYLTVDARQTPHRVYSLTDEGRSKINISRRAGRDYGDYIGDLRESALHRLLVLAGCRYLADRFVADSDSPAVAVNAYHPVGANRLDAAAVAADGDIVAALEAETDTHDHRTGVPADYDTIAACQPDAAVWVVTSRSTGHSVLDALNDPAAGDARVTKTYSESTPPHQFRIDTPGCTKIISSGRLLKTVDRESGPASRYLRNGP
jgi:hypothetical protein